MKEDGDNFVFTVSVSNTGSVDGREAVQIYMQSPYTDYDRENGIEKAARPMCWLPALPRM